MMIDKYQLYFLWKNLKKMWEAKRFNTAVFHAFFDVSLEDYLITTFINDNYKVEYMSNFGINLINEMNCGLITVYDWVEWVIVKAMQEGKFPDLKDVNSKRKIINNMIFTRRDEIIEQAKLINKIIEEKNTGVNELFDTKFTLYDLDEHQENEAYKMYKQGLIHPEFFIRGFIANKFSIDVSIVKDTEYKRFITFTKIIKKIEQEKTEKNKCSN